MQKLFDARLVALSLVDMNELVGSSRICSIIIEGNYSFVVVVVVNSNF